MNPGKKKLTLEQNNNSILVPQYRTSEIKGLFKDLQVLKILFQYHSELTTRENLKHTEHRDGERPEGSQSALTAQCPIQ